MLDLNIWALMSLALGLGILHALDADHVIAVTGLSSHSADKKTSIRFCMRWALGHSVALLMIGIVVLFLGMAIPERLSAYAENLVGVMLIVIGTYVLWDVYRKQAHLHFHQHDGFTHHAHWHHHQHSSYKDEHKKDPHEHTHAPVFIGVLHGIAGSAPLLALLPLSQMSSAWIGLAYLFVFGIGVLVAMLVFGGLIGQVFTYVKCWGNKLVNAIRIAVSILSIAYGSSLVLGAM